MTPKPSLLKPSLATLLALGIAACASTTPKGGAAPSPRACISPEPTGPSCAKDADCVIAFDLCGYRSEPIQDRWKPTQSPADHRQATEHAAAKVPHCGSRAELAAGSNAKPRRWLGDRARCVAGRCHTVTSSCYRP